MQLSRRMIPALLSLIWVSGAQAGPFALVSGFDDVLRQAENHSLWRAGLKLFEKDKTFAGMPELYTGLVEAGGQENYSLVSGISSIFEERIRNFLSESHYPKVDLYLRSWLTQWSISRFKIDSIRKAMTKDPSLGFIVIFDNSRPSIDMVRSIPEAFPGRVLAMYLRQVVQRPETPGALQFITAMDIAMEEHRAGRLAEDSLKRVAEAILAEKDPEQLLIPHYAYCPKVYDPCGATNEPVLAECMKVRDKVVSLCSLR